MWMPDDNKIKEEKTQMKKTKLLKKIGVFSLSALVLMGAGFTEIGNSIGTNISVSAVDVYTEGDFQYCIFDGEADLRGYVGSGGDVVIPSTLGGYPVTSLFYRCFAANRSITSVVIPDSVTYIGESSFLGCWNLKSVKLPENLETIGISAFRSCTHLSEISIPDSVAVIGTNAFEGCSGFTEFTFPEGLESTSYGVLDNCYNLKSVTIPSSVKVIGPHSFSNCRSLTHIDLPDGLTEIGINAFHNCSGLTSIDIPEGVERIGGAAFARCSSLSGIVFPDKVTKIEQFVLANCESLKEFTIPNKVTEIEDYAFSKCTALEKMEIPGSVKNIEDEAFENCSSLSTIIIPDTVTDLGKDTFKDCNLLTIYGSSGNAAHQYANDNNISFAEYKPLKNTSSISEKAIIKGSSVTVSCNSQGGIGETQYAVFYKQKAQTRWTCAQNYSLNTTVNITPKASTTYNVRIKAKDTFGKITNKDFTLTANKPLKNTSSIAETTIKKGSSVTVNCNSEGGMGNTQYAVFYKQKAQTRWTCAQNYKENKIINITPKAAVAYDIRIKAKDKSGTIKNKDFTLSVTR